MGISCHCPFSSNGESATILDIDQEEEEDANSISLEDFFNLIPKHILEKMQLVQRE